MTGGRPLRILVPGADGQVGWALARADPQIVAFGRKELDIADPTAVAARMEEVRPDLVVNAAAYTAVDRAEEDAEAAFKANRDGPAHLAAACARAGIPLIHLSTDYVFDGRRTEPYAESDAPSPLGVYGESKWAGEEAVRQTLERHLTLRVSWVFGIHGNNFVKSMLRLGAELEELGVVADQRGCPTAADDIAATLLTLGRKIVDDPPAEAWGTFHYGGQPDASWFEFAQAIFQNKEAPAPRLRAIPTSDYPTRAERPADSTLDCRRLKRVFGIERPDWREALKRMIDSLAEGEGS